MPAAPWELQLQRSFLTFLKCQRGLKRAPGSRRDHNQLDFAQPACFPRRKVAAIAPMPTSPRPGAGPFRTAALLRSRRDEGPRCSWGAGRGRS